MLPLAQLVHGSHASVPLTMHPLHTCSTPAGGSVHRCVLRQESQCTCLRVHAQSLVLSVQWYVSGQRLLQYGSIVDC